MKYNFITVILAGFLLPEVVISQGEHPISLSQPEIKEINSNKKIGLPVRVRSFQLSQMDQSVILKWETDSESQNNYFEIQRSVSEGPFESIVLIFAEEGKPAGAKYSFSDFLAEDLMNVNLTYRLIQVGRNGEAIRMGLYKIGPGRNAKLRFTWNENLYSSSLMVETDSGETTNLFLNLYQADGELKFKQEFRVYPGYNIFSVYNLEGMSPGNYVAELKDYKRVWGRQKLVKQH